MAAVIRTTTDAPTVSEVAKRGLVNDALTISESLRVGIAAYATESLTASLAARLGVAGRASDALSISEAIRNTKFFRVTETLSATVVTTIGGPPTIWKTTLTADTQFNPGIGASLFGVFDGRGTIPIKYAFGLAPILVMSASGGKVLYNNGTSNFGYYDPVQLVFAWGASGVFADHLTITESVTRSVNVFRTATDSLTISEVARKAPQGFATDTLTISENVTRLGVFKRTCTESLSTSEAATQSDTTVHVTADTLHISELVTRLLVLFRFGIDPIIDQNLNVLFAASTDCANRCFRLGTSVRGLMTSMSGSTARLTTICGSMARFGMKACSRLIPGRGVPCDNIANGKHQFEKTIVLPAGTPLSIDLVNNFAFESSLVARLTVSRLPFLRVSELAAVHRNLVRFATDALTISESVDAQLYGSRFTRCARCAAHQRIGGQDH